MKKNQGISSAQRAGCRDWSEGPCAQQPPLCTLRSEHTHGPGCAGCCPTPGYQGRAVRAVHPHRATAAAQRLALMVLPGAVWESSQAMCACASPQTLRAWHLRRVNGRQPINIDTRMNAPSAQSVRGQGAPASVQQHQPAAGQGAMRSRRRGARAGQCKGKFGKGHAPKEAQANWARLRQDFGRRVCAHTQTNAHASVICREPARQRPQPARAAGSCFCS